MEESLCESKHGEGGPREWPEHPLAALAAAGRRVRERGAGWSEIQNETLKPAPPFCVNHDLGRRLCCLDGDSGPTGNFGPERQKFWPKPAPAPKDGIGLV